MMTSTDGTTWRGPFPVSTAPSDQWFPWVDVNPVTGKVGVLFHDRSYGNPALYDTTLAEGDPTLLQLHQGQHQTVPSQKLDLLPSRRP